MERRVDVGGRWVEEGDEGASDGIVVVPAEECFGGRSPMDDRTVAGGNDDGIAQFDERVDDASEGGWEGAGVVAVDVEVYRRG